MEHQHPTRPRAPRARRFTIPIDTMSEKLYRICAAEDWAHAQATGALPMSPLDLRDGFFHLSLASQVAQTLARYFITREGIVLLTIAADRLVEGSLRFEAPRHGARRGEESRPRPEELFPHFYGRVPTRAILSADVLSLDQRGVHELPLALREVARRELIEVDALQLRLAWDERRGVALLEYPRETRITDEAGALAWEALLERRVAKLTEARGKVPLVVCVDNLWVAPKLERRYLELVDKLISRAFSTVARWSGDRERREYFARANRARQLPSQVFASREDAIACALGHRDEA